MLISKIYMSNIISIIRLCPTLNFAITHALALGSWEKPHQDQQLKWWPSFMSGAHHNMQPAKQLIFTGSPYAGDSNVSVTIPYFFWMTQYCAHSLVWRILGSRSRSMTNVTCLRSSFFYPPWMKADKLLGCTKLLTLGSWVVAVHYS